MPRHMQQRRRWPLVLGVVLCIGVGGVAVVQGTDWIDAAFTTKNTTTTKPKAKSINQVKLAVPLVNQMTAPRLYNGCEVTSLTMLFNYAHINVTKNELASRITTVPLIYSNGQHGNPNTGFVGDITGSQPGLGVYHGPIYKLAKTETKHVRDLTGHSFSDVIKQLEKGRPVWTITTASFAPVSTMQTWSTPTGNVKVTYDMHSVVIVGFNRAKKVIYINNPYGKRQQAVSWKNFAAAYRQMGSQAIVLTLKH